MLSWKKKNLSPFQPIKSLLRLWYRMVKVANILAQLVKPREKAFNYFGSQRNIAVWVLIFLGSLMACDTTIRDPQPQFPDQPFVTPTFNFSLPVNGQTSFRLADSLSLRQDFTITLGNPAVGRIEANGPAYTYFPMVNFIGKDSVAYTVCVGSRCQDGRLRFQVSDPTNCQLQAKNDTLSIASGSSITYDVSLNDQKCDTSAKFSIVTAPNNGRASISPEGLLTYTANSGVTGTDVLTYQISREGRTAVRASVLVRIVTNCDPVANNDEYEVQNGRVIYPFPILANDRFCGTPTAPPTVEIVGTPENCLVTIGPNGGANVSIQPTFVGLARFSYRILENGRASNAAQVEITVTQRCIPVALDDEVTMDAGQTILINLKANDPTTCPDWSYALSASVRPNAGLVRMLDPVNGLVSFTAAPRAEGLAVFDYNFVNSQFGQTALGAQVRITIVGSPFCDSVASIMPDTIILPGGVNEKQFNFRQVILEKLPCRAEPNITTIRIMFTQPQNWQQILSPIQPGSDTWRIRRQLGLNMPRQIEIFYSVTMVANQRTVEGLGRLVVIIN